jgi:hypothetical protein
MEIMNTNLNTQVTEQNAIESKRFNNAYLMAKELFPELKHQQWTTLANCLIQVLLKDKH